MKELQRLDLSDNQFTGSIPATFMASAVNATNVTSQDQWIINLNGNNLGGFIPSSLERLAGLNLTLYLADNAFRGFEDSTLCNNINWNNGQVALFGCDGIACPVGTSSLLGQSTSANQCKVCAASIFLGTTTCLDSNDKGAFE